MTRLLDTTAAAMQLGLAVSTLEKQRVRGDGPAFLKLGRAVRYRAADLEEWLIARRVNSTSEYSA